MISIPFELAMAAVVVLILLVLEVCELVRNRRIAKESMRRLSAQHLRQVNQEFQAQSLDSGPPHFPDTIPMNQTPYRTVRWNPYGFREQGDKVQDGKGKWVRKQGGFVIPFLVICLCVFLIGVMLAASKREQERWAIFSVEHECKLVAVKSSEVIPTTAIGANGQLVTGTTVIPSQKSYLCNDGVTYTR